ncbi:glycoside hydrolase family 61 protein [Jaapia argillacea MUCL 33604]|uniref:lytic cellulose monooxygenase (C4-dehydrogenating) n=1 Tax=Jaapia argillacea MUCL 33604 TaxID=933084 RepID=A0A067PT15_9AGAM|nr:glycoside hydrolase family 61 protein [Jaapia argillacea MUCL 33604]
MTSFQISRIIPILFLWLFIPIVVGHGFVHTVAIGNKDYPGWSPFSDPYASPLPQRIVRKIPSDGPIEDAKSANISCNAGGETGTPVVAEVAAGTTVTFDWSYWPSDHLGPVSTYMTSCNSNCSSFDVSGAKWFKIDAAGYDNGQWASAKLIADNFLWNSTVPEALAPGQYLMRHEIVALHTVGAPQFYPSCTQVEITGSGSGKPASQDLVAIPGVYDDTQWPDIYTNFGTFAIPGPEVVNLGGGGSSPSSASSTASSSTSTPTNGTTCGLSKARLSKRHRIVKRSD